MSYNIPVARYKIKFKYNELKCVIPISLSFIAVPPSELKMLQQFRSPVERGRTVQAICQTDSANPTPNIHWRKNNEIITNHMNSLIITTREKPGDYNANYISSTLTVIASTENDQAEFSCVIIDVTQVPTLTAGPTSFRLQRM